MERKITRRSAIKRMGAAVAGVAVSGTLPAFAVKAMGVEDAPQNVIPGNQNRQNADSQPAAQADDPKASTLKMDYKLVYEGPDVVFHQIDEHLWVGNGHQMYNESVYIVEGEDRAMLIDTGTRIDHLDEIVAGITKKPLTVALTHTHGDHAGSVKWFDEIWMMQADGIRPPRGYEGRISYISNHQKFELGGRTLEAFYTPGHTRDSVTFIDSRNHLALSGDAFGSTNLLMTCELSTFIRTAEETLKMMCDKEIYYMLPGHFDGTNAETSKRVYDLWVVATEVLAGKREGEISSSGMGLNRRVTYEGVRFNYNDRMLK